MPDSFVGRPPLHVRVEAAPRSRERSVLSCIWRVLPFRVLFQSKASSLLKQALRTDCLAGFKGPRESVSNQGADRGGSTSSDTAAVGRFFSESASETSFATTQSSHQYSQATTLMLSDNDSCYISEPDLPQRGAVATQEARQGAGFSQTPPTLAPVVEAQTAERRDRDQGRQSDFYEINSYAASYEAPAFGPSEAAPRYSSFKGDDESNVSISQLPKGEFACQKSSRKYTSKQDNTTHRQSEYNSATLRGQHGKNGLSRESTPEF